MLIRITGDQRLSRVDVAGDFGVSVRPFWGGGGGGGGGGADLLMNEFSRDRANSTTLAASPRVRQVIIEEAREALRARHVMMLGLDQRISQTAAALFAAGAFCLTLAFGGDVTATLACLISLSGVSFFIGAVFCVVALRAGDFVFPGSSPSWWASADFLDREDGDGHALTWAAGNWEEAIASCDRLATRRARWFNLALNYAMAGAACAAVTAVLVFFGGR